MNPQQWAAVDQYIQDTLVRPHKALNDALKSSKAAGLPEIQVSASQGKFLNILATMIGAHRILEIGTLGGYSTIWLARALGAGGRLVTLELDGKYAEVAQANLERAGLAGKVEIITGPALESLARLAEMKSGPYDLIFIDADKVNNAEYFAWALRLSRKGSVIIVDNVVREGGVIDAASKDAGVLGVRRMNKLMAAEKRVSVTALQTVGSKGYDGFAIALVIQDS